MHFSLFVKNVSISWKTLDNKDINQISEPSGCRENMGLVGVPILAGSQTWFQSLLLRIFQFLRGQKAKKGTKPAAQARELEQPDSR